MDIEAATNPVEGEDTSADTLPETQEVDTEGQTETEPQYDGDGNPIEGEPAEDDSEEVEHEGRKYKVPKAVKPLLLMQADYTRKTQEVAEQRKALEGERQALQQATQAEVGALAQLTAIDQQLAAYGRVDWNAWNDSDPFEAQKAFMQFTQLKDARGSAVGQLTQLQQQRALATQQETARRIEQAAGVLAREIEGGWDATKAAEVMEGGIREYRFDRSEIEELSDARMVIALHDALQWRAHLKSQKKLANLARGQEVQPAKTLRGTAASTPVRADTNDFRAFEKMAERKLSAG